MKSVVGYLRRKRLEGRLEKPPYVYRQKVENVEILFSVHNWVEYHNRARDSYTGEPDTVQWIKSNLRAGDVLWDVGANVGAYTLFAAKIVPSARVVAFEPYIPTHAHLWENIVLNDSMEQIIPLCIALSDHTCIDVLGISDPRAGSSQHVLGSNNFQLRQPLIALTGDDVVRSFDLQHPNLMKIDVDGYETNVLEGMSGVLADSSLRSLLVEVEKDKTEESIDRILTASGFRREQREKTEVAGNVFNSIYVRG